MARGAPIWITQDGVRTISLSQIAETITNSPDLLEEMVFGDIEVPWVKLDFRTEREGISNNISLSLHVTVQPKMLPSHLSWKKECCWASRHTIRGDKFLIREVQDVEALVLHTFQQMASQYAPSFYEIDPRIGFSFASPTMPACPLFDPPQGVRRPRVAFQAYQKSIEFSRDTGLPRASYKSLHTPCVFCSEDVMDSECPDGILWGGGNIGWVHEFCAPWLPDSRKP